MTAPSFERTLSALTAAIGDVERLRDLTPDQRTRVRAAITRLITAAWHQHSKETTTCV